MEKLKYTKIRKVKSPVRANARDAGIDLFIPEDLSFDDMSSKFGTTGCQLPVKFAHDGKTIEAFTLRPQQSILIPSGLKFNIPPGHALIAFNKSGIAAKKGLLVGSAVCDEEYEGEVHINLHNASNKDQTINAGDKIVQFLVMPINYCELEEISTVNELYKNKVSNRGEGGFGSTGVN